MVIDKSNMRQVMIDFPRQCREALTLTGGIKVQESFNKILVCGMGGSAISGDLLKAYLYDLSLPVFVSKDYDIPGFIDEETLVFAVSYSGETEETLSALEKAKSRGAKVVAITSGGKLAEMADVIIKIPAGLQPRNALGYLFFPMLGVLYNSGAIDIKNSELNDTLKVLSNVKYFDDRGQELARKIKDRIPIIYSSAKMEPCAFRLKCEINENSKHPAYYHVFPELCHNELVCLQSMDKADFMILIIKSNDDHERNKLRMKICKDIFEGRLEVEEIEAVGDSLISNMFSVIYLGDWVSYHLALWKHVDPTPVYIIEELKEKLKG